MNARELAIQRETTRWFIAADSIGVYLNRDIKEMTPSGGEIVASTQVLPLQIFRLIPSSDSVAESQTGDGRAVHTSFILLGMWDCDMQRFDRFLLGGVEFEITSPVRPEHTLSVYERKGDVTRRG